MTRFSAFLCHLTGSLLFLVTSRVDGVSASLRFDVPGFDQTVVFGDSLSDTGNVRTRTGAISGGLIDYPSQTFNYSDGRFTNSSDTTPSSINYVGVWHEQLARTFLHIPPATYSLSGGTDYAFGGATTEGGARNVPIVPTPFGDLVISIDDMGKQVDDYLASHPINPNALYLLWGGSNDVFNDDSDANVLGAAARIAGLVNRLATAGARYIMVLNLPPLGTIPASTEPGTIAVRNRASANFRRQLRVDLMTSMNFLAPQGITPTLYQVDIWSAMIRLFCNPGIDGFIDTRTESQGNSNADPDQFVFWDGVHPTTAGHFWAARCAHDAITIPVTTPAKALNISTRLFVDTGERISIVGFIVTGAVPKRVLIRGIGPSLHASGISNPLVDPTLSLLDDLQNTLFTNDNWRDTQEPEILATGIPPQDNLESAIVVTLGPGSYTAVLAGKNEGTGNGLVEVYDLEPAANSTLANLSTRGFVGTSDDVMIGGLTFSEGDSSLTVLRAMGPSLAGAGIANPLLDPAIELHDGNGASIAENDNWRDGQLQAAQATELAPADDRESAIVAFLAPGNYTAVVRGNAGTSGVALVEAYSVR